MACWTSSGPPYFGLYGEAFWEETAALPFPRPSSYAHAAEPTPSRLATTVDVGRVEERLPRAFEDADRLPTSLTGFKVLKAGQSMFKAQSRWTLDNGRCWQCVRGCCVVLHTLVFGCNMRSQKGVATDLIPERIRGGLRNCSSSCLTAARICAHRQAPLN